MVEDALASGRHIGMVQPTVPRQDNAPQPNAPADQPEVYPIGCAGLIEEVKRVEDGRFLITLVGASRFRVREELPLLRGYRRVTADYGAFASDHQPAVEALDTSPLIAALKTYGDAYRVAFDVERLSHLPTPLLVNGLAMSLPFRPAEKQALLEALTLSERQQLVLGLMGMGLQAGRFDGTHTPPTLN
jgi:Lon protease-like protein